MKKIVLILLSLYMTLSVTLLDAQEFNFSINVNTKQVGGTDQRVYEALQEGVMNFFNNQVWTNIKFTDYERIEGGIVITVKEKKAAQGVQAGLTKEEAAYLAQHYGSNVEKVYDYVAKADGTMPAALFAQLQYGIEQELVATPVDFLVRRTGNMFFNIASVKAHKEAVVAHMAQQLGWSDEQIALFTEQLNIEIMRATTAK